MRQSDDQGLFQPFPSPKGAGGVALERKRRPIGDVHVVTCKEHVQTFLDGQGGFVLEIINFLLSFVLVILSVVDTYHETTNTDMTTWLDQFAFGATFLFAFDFGLNLYGAMNRQRFIMSPMGIVDLVTIIPTFVAFFLASISVSLLPMLRVVRVFRMLSVLRLFRIVQSYRGFDYQARLGVLTFMIFALIFVAAGTFQILEEPYYESQNSRLEFHEAIYFVFVTISTVGYGDISPRTTGARFFVILMIIVVVTVIPRQLNRLIELSKLQHDYMHGYDLRKRSFHNGGHVLVTGCVTFESVSEFLAEFYRLRKGRVNMDVVFLGASVPSNRLQELLLHVNYRRRVTYLKGSLLSGKDAQRAHVESAAAVFILATTKNSKHTEAADALTVLQALAIDKFCFRNSLRLNEMNPQRRRTRTFLQILSPQRTHGLRTITGVEVALNTPRLRTAILARSVLCPGATALLLNLIYSAPESDTEDAKDSNVPWIAEYAHGLQHQLFPVVLPRYFHGLLYEDAVAKLYAAFQIMFIALYDESAVNHGHRRIKLCPFGHFLREHEIGFFIALSVSHAQNAADKLEEFAQRSSNTAHALPTLVFCSESVLDRQSIVGEKVRSQSILMSDGTDADEVDSDNDHGPMSPRVETIRDAFRVIRASSFASSSSDSSSNGPPLLPPFLRRQSQLHQTVSSLSISHRKRLQGHIIISGPYVQGHQLACYLDDLYNLEKGIVEERPTILLLVKAFPSEADIESIDTPLPPNVFIEKGISQNVEDLLKIRAFEAKAVLMIPGNWKYHVDDFREEKTEDVNDHLMDYQVIMSTLSLRTVQELHHEHLAQSDSGASSHSKRIKYRRLAKEDQSSLRPPTLASSVVKCHESINYFAYKSNSNFAAQYHTHHHHTHQHHHHILLHPKVPRSEIEGILPAAFAPSYAAGEIFVDSVLDTLLCQSFFNPYVIDLIRALAGDHYYHMSHRSAGGASTDQDTFSSTVVSYFHTSRVGSSTNLTSGDATDAGEEHQDNATSSTAPESDEEDLKYPVLSIATVAPELEGEQFDVVFARALEQEVLVLGIYRRPNNPRRGNSLPYVVTCPDGDADMAIERGDMLHVLAKHRAPVRIH